MNTGKLKYRVEFYTVTATLNGQLGYSAVETLASSRYADVRQLSQSETLTSGQVVGENNFEIKVRRAPDEIMPKSTLIKWNGRRMNITSIQADDFYLTIQATEQAT